MTFLKQTFWLLDLRCEEASRLASESLDRPLTRLERTALRLHLLICRACREFRRQIRLIRRAAGDLASPPEGEPLAPGLSPEARDRIKRALRGG